MEVQAQKLGFALPRFSRIGPKAFSGSVVLAAYLMINKVAENKHLGGEQTGRAADGVFHNVWSTSISLLPMALAIIGLQSVLVLNHQRNAKAARFASAALVPSLTAADCEQLVGDSYRSAGYTVIENRGHKSDGGVDLVLHRGAEKLYAQCRYWKDETVGHEIVIRLAATMRTQGATGGLVISSGQFTAEARACAAACAVQLLDAGAVSQMMQLTRD
jgi:Restriction endonuclease